MNDISALENMIVLCDHILDKLPGQMVRLRPSCFESVMNYIFNADIVLDDVKEYEVLVARIRTLGGRSKIRLTLDIAGVHVVLDSTEVTFN